MIIFIYDKFWTPRKFKIALSLNAQNSSPCLFSVFNENEHFRYCWRAKAIALATGCVKYCFKFLIHTALRRDVKHTIPLQLLHHCSNCVQFTFLKTFFSASLLSEWKVLQMNTIHIKALIALSFRQWTALLDQIITFIGGKVWLNEVRLRNTKIWFVFFGNHTKWHPRHKMYCVS